ncbi:MAG: nuclear transport factor 2 family protein [Cereibacter changlensis]
MYLPTPVQAFFQAEKLDSPELLASAFSDRARVYDESGIHVGPEAIRDWWLSTKASRHCEVRPMSVDRQGDRVTVHTRVSGKFSGSSATRRFSFRLSGNRIAELEIDA